MAKSSDKALVEYLVLAAKRGNQHAFASLYAKTNKQLIMAAYRVTGNLAAAEDICQDVWLKMARRLRKINEPAAFMANAYQLVRWRSLDHIKRAGKDSILDEGLASVDPSPEEVAEISSVKRAMALLQPSQRLIVQMFYSDGYSVPEIATMLELKVGTIKTRLFRAREAIKQMLQVPSENNESNSEGDKK